MQAVILAGGIGTRLKPLTEKVPKTMIPVYGRPFLEYQLSLLKRSGISNVVLCIGYLGSKIKKHFGNGEKFGLKISYSEEGNKLLGTAGALKKAERLLEDEFFVTYGDAYLMLDYRGVMQRFKKSKKLGLMVVYKNFDKYDRSNVVVGGGLVKVYSKKRKAPGMVYIDFGVSAFRKEALALVPKNKVVDLEDLNQKLIEKGELLAFETDQRFYEVGGPESLKEFEALMSSGKIKI
ncbi:MAG: sugar phosphate nucleotidyltransferase [Candidatus Hadarchaeota archaeon]